MNSEDLAGWRGSISPVEDCPYLESGSWQNFVLDPGPGISPEAHEHLLESGFRRMGGMFFQPVCPECQECRSMRIDTTVFKPSKSLRRARNRNCDLTIEVTEPRYTEEKRALLDAYLESRHSRSDGG